MLHTGFDGSFIWSLKTDHIQFSDIRHVSPSQMDTASLFQIPSPVSSAVKFDRRTGEVSKARSKAKFWYLPDGYRRPLPMGNDVDEEYLQIALDCRSATCSDWESACGDEDKDIPGVSVRYYYDGDAPEGNASNLNSLLLSGTLFDLPVVMEFN